MHRFLGAILLAWIGSCALACAQDRAAIEAGEALYEEHCVSCHGEKLRNPGTSFDLRVMGAFDVNDGKIKAWRDYFDPSQFNSQTP